MFAVLSSWLSHCESSPGSFGEQRQVAADLCTYSPCNCFQSL